MLPAISFPNTDKMESMMYFCVCASQTKGDCGTNPMASIWSIPSGPLVEKKSLIRAVITSSLSSPPVSPIHPGVSTMVSLNSKGDPSSLGNEYEVIIV